MNERDLAHDSGIWVFDTQNRKIVASIESDSFSFLRAIALTPDERQLYVVDGSGTTSIVSTETNTVVKTLPGFGWVSGTNFIAPGVDLLTSQALTGAWYDPAYDGSGFNLTMTPAGLLAYYYGWDRGGNRLWLMSDLGPSTVIAGHPVTLNMSHTNGGHLMTPALPETLTPWGALTLDFAADGAAASATLSGTDGDANLNLQKLVGLGSEASVTGLWYDPRFNGSGFNMAMTSAGLLAYYYGWDKNGNRLWLMSDLGPASIAQGDTLTLPMRMTTGGRFLTPAKPSTLTPWGSLRINFTNCTQATATLSRNDDSVVMNDLQLLIGMLNRPPC
jgi:hypothetical protein